MLSPSTDLEPCRCPLVSPSTMVEHVARVRKDIDEKPPSLQATHPEAGERRENWASLVKEFDASALETCGKNDC